MPWLEDGGASPRKKNAELRPREYLTQLKNGRAPQPDVTAAGFRNQLTRIAQAAGFPFLVHPPMLRHACAFKLAHDRHDTCAIQAWLGHRNI